MILRRASTEDAQTLFDWANDPVTRQNSFSREPIPWEKHIGWLRRKLAAPECLLLILENDEGVPCGTIRYDLQEDKTAVISYSIAPEQRGRGYGSRIIELGEAEALRTFGPLELLAEVKPENKGSIKCFQRNGYDAAGATETELVFKKHIL